MWHRHILFKIKRTSIFMVLWGLTPQVSSLNLGANILLFSWFCKTICPFLFLHWKIDSNINNSICTVQI